MSDEQIKQILARLDKQDKDSLEYREEREKLDQERLTAHWKVLEFLKQTNNNLTKQINDIQTEIKPIVDLARSVRGFDKISMWILKFILGIAAFLTAMGTIIYVIRKLLVPK